MQKLFKLILLILLTCSISSVNSIGETIKNSGDYKGVIEKPGADTENITWKNARKKETDHFVVRTNLSIDALNDICIVMEYAYFTLNDIFRFPEPDKKCNVSVFRTNDEYVKLFTELTGGAIPCPTRSAFIYGTDAVNKSKEDQGLVCYQPSRTILPSLLHFNICLTNQLLAYSSGLATMPPLWFTEGLNLYIESSGIAGKRLATDVVDPERLSLVQQAIKDNAYFPLKDFVIIPYLDSNEVTSLHFPEAWSLVYFLLHSKNGKYKNTLRAYIDALGKGNMWRKDEDTHIRLFEEVTGVPIDKLEGEWKNYIISLRSKDKLESEAKREEAIKKLGEYKGVMEKPGADTENTPWENARKKETDHFVVRTNLSIDALNDICIVMEYAYFTLKDIFRFPEPDKKCNVSVFRNNEEYVKLFTELTNGAIPCPRHSAFIYGTDSNNKSKEDQALIYYHIDGRRTILPSLLHFNICLTNQSLACGSGLATMPPLWFTEGLSLYIESSGIAGKRLATDVVDPERLSLVQQAIKDNAYFPLKDFVILPHLDSNAVTRLHFPEAWSLVYFLLHSKNGKYKDTLRTYIYALGKDSMWRENEEAHIKLFEEVTGIPIDKLEEEWKDYIISLRGKDKLESEAKKEETIKKLGVYKGVLHKSGVDKENLPWGKARKKETDHFIVKTNLSVDALNDICILMEHIYLTYLDFFRFPEPKEKLKVVVTKNRDEFDQIENDLTGTKLPQNMAGHFLPKGDPKNKSPEDYFITYYDPAYVQKEGVRVFFHESVHYVMTLLSRDVCPPAPIWVEEGICSYFELSSFENNKLVTNIISQIHLPVINQAIKGKTYIKLRDFINLYQSKYLAKEKICYAEGWSLVYFLLNCQNGKYKSGFQAYLEAWKKGKITYLNTGREIQDPDGHIKLFEKAMDVPIDKLEEEWKEYILSLK